MLSSLKLWCRSKRLPIRNSFRYNNSVLTIKQSKVYESSANAVADMRDGSSIFFGGFGPCGLPENLITAVCNANIKNLKCVTNNPGLGPVGVSKLIINEQVSSVINSYPGPNVDVLERMFDGRMRLEVLPQGSLTERIRAAGAGIPAFYTATGVGTDVQFGKIAVRYNKDGTVAEYSQKKESKIFNGKEFILEEAMYGDYALIKAWKGDKLGNCVFKGTARNFNPDMAKAVKCCIVEVEELVEPGELDPNEVHLPGVYVDRIVKGEMYARRIWKQVDPHDDEEVVKHLTLFEKSEQAKRGAKEAIASRAALEFRDGLVVNLGIGIPDYAANYIPEGMNILIHSENGIIGMGPTPATEDEEDPDLLNASKEPISYVKGSSIVSSSDSFGLIRGGHLDLAIIGALQVSQTGDLANWCIPGKMMKGIGGAMDLVAGVENIIVCTSHCERDSGKSKILKQCTLPLTGKIAAKVIITDMAVFKVKEDGSGLLLTELEKGVSLEDIKQCTEADYTVSPDLKEMQHATFSGKYASNVNVAASKVEHSPTSEVGMVEDLSVLFSKLKLHKDYNALKSTLKGPFGGMMLPAVLPLIAKQSPELARAIKADKNGFLKLINDDCK